MPLALFSKVGEQRQALEQSILEKIQAVSQGHTSDHVQFVSIILEITGGKDWRKKAQKWVSGDEMPPKIQGSQSLVETISIQTEIFRIPLSPVDENRVAVMMPFSAEFDGTYNAIKQACDSVGLKAVRSDDIWANSTFMQDVFDIIYCSRIVIVDFSERNPKVMY